MKRLLDLLIAVPALILLLPIILAVLVLVWIKLGSPVFFVQTRPGIGKKTFYMYKFRTMTDLVDNSGILLPDKERLTKFGKFLRSTSLDELPALWNVINGSMSLVGPRPLLIEYLPLYSTEQARRHDVLPGITGWAQINGRNAISWEKKFELDIWYVDNQSLLLDVKILLLTIRKVLMREDINAEGHSTMQKFSGGRS